MGVKRLASACTRAFDLNTIYGGGKEGQYKAGNGQGVAGVGKRGRGKVAKGGSKMSKVVHNEGRRQERRGFAGGDVVEGYGGDDRGVRPSQGRPRDTQKQ